MLRRLSGEGRCSPYAAQNAQGETSQGSLHLTNIAQLNCGRENALMKILSISNTSEAPQRDRSNSNMLPRQNRRHRRLPGRSHNLQGHRMHSAARPLDRRKASDRQFGLAAPAQRNMLRVDQLRCRSRTLILRKPIVRSFHLRRTPEWPSRDLPLPLIRTQTQQRRRTLQRRIYLPYRRSQDPPCLYCGTTPARKLARALAPHRSRP